MKIMRLTAQHELPCGHFLEHQAASTFADDDTSDATKSRARKFAVEILQYWFASRTPRHVCELVSEENTNGLRPRLPGEETTCAALQDVDSTSLSESWQEYV